MARRIALLALVAASLVAAPARAAGNGTIVVRLAVDPVPAGVAWTYTGAGTSFRLGLGTTSHTIGNLTAGTYTIGERSPDPQRPSTLTGVTCSDPSGGSKGTIATATATVRLAADETVVCTFTHRALGPVPTAAALDLAQQFAPTLRFAAAEQYTPLALQDYLAQTSLRAGKPPHGKLVQSHPTLFTLPVTPAATYLDIRGAEPYSNKAGYLALQRQLAAKRRPTVYWHMTRQASTGRIALEYWFLYLYNDFVDQHEADWEGVTVVVQNGAPIGATYSQHQGRVWTQWPAATPDGHPVVYVAAGSHANYPLPGRYAVKVCYDAGVRRCTTTAQRDDARGNGATLTVDDYDLHELGGTGYSGSWGSGNYVLGFGPTGDRITDPRRRSEYTNPFAAVPPGA
jgi:hypothetical protein